jgi:hypothetical protein
MTATLTFDGLATLEPALLRFADEATEAARNGWAGWLEWLPGYGGWRDAIRNAAEQASMDAWDVQDLVLAHLADVFAVAQRRTERRRAGTVGDTRAPGGGVTDGRGFSKTEPTRRKFFHAF